MAAMCAPFPHLSVAKEVLYLLLSGCGMLSTFSRAFAQGCFNLASFEGRHAMIQLTRLNKERLMVNCDFIKFVEEAPDTVITLIAGEKIVVRESSQEILAKIIEFRRAIAASLARPPGPPPSAPGHSNRPATTPEEQV
jgi:flagellar protein FlbD